MVILSRAARLERLEARLVRRRPDRKAEAFERAYMALRGALGLRVGQSCDDPVRALRDRLALGSPTDADRAVLAALPAVDLEAVGMMAEAFVALFAGITDEF